MSHSKISEDALKSRMNCALFMKRLGISRRTFFNWRAKRVPAERVIEVEEKVGIPRQILRPDLWPPA